MIETLYKPFRHWSEKGSVYILSDTHFNDGDCRLMDPDWVSPEQQLRIINYIVHKDDTFICLGDVGDPSYASQIKCPNKILIMGNHDRRSDYQEIFTEIYTGPLFISDKILLSHEPVEGLNWCLNIHGHNHDSNVKNDMYHINLAANVCLYTPASLKSIIRSGALSDINTIHRLTIDKQIDSKKKVGIKTKL